MQDERQGKPSASGAPQWFPCPGSFLAGGESLPSDAAAAGTAQHEVLEANEEDGGWSVEATKQTESLLVDTAMNGDPVLRQIRERRFWISDAASAKPDVVYASASRVVVINYKFGREVCDPAPTNDQVSVEMAAVYEWFWQEYRRAPDVVVGAIIQPLAPAENQITHTSRRPAGMDWRRDEIIERARAAMQPGAKRIPGAHCKWCKAVNCAAGIAYATTLEAIEQATPEAAGRILDAANVAEAMIPRLFGAALDRLAAGEAIAGWEPKPGLALGGIEERIRRREKCTEAQAKAMMDIWLAGLIEKKPFSMERRGITDKVEAAVKLAEVGFTPTEISAMGGIRKVKAPKEPKLKHGKAKPTAAAVPAEA